MQFPEEGEWMSARCKRASTAGADLPRASCHGPLPPGPLAPEDAGLPVLAVPSAQMLLLPLRSTRVVTAGLWQARGCPPRQ